MELTFGRLVYSFYAIISCTSKVESCSEREHPFSFQVFLTAPLGLCENKIGQRWGGHISDTDCIWKNVYVQSFDEIRVVEDLHRFFYP